MCHPQNMFFSLIENLIIENYHDTKKLTVSQKMSFTWSVSLHVKKMSDLQGTSTLRTSLKKNISEKDAAYIFVRKTFKIRNGSLSQSQMF